MGSTKLSGLRSARRISQCEPTTDQSPQLYATVRPGRGRGHDCPAAARRGRPSLARADELETSGERAEEAAQAKDTVAQIATAALIAEDLATTFYYNGLVGGVITDPNLAGPGGTADNVGSGGNPGTSTTSRPL